MGLPLCVPDLATLSWPDFLINGFLICSLPEICVENHLEHESQSQSFVYKDLELCSGVFGHAPSLRTEADFTLVLKIQILFSDRNSEAIN